ncbi:MAG: PKD domain-containing protein [Planctomycetaceae bacterium]|nr:MAG: PKD domain-containing protein [Planctomycetaceae bacterium]
MNKPQMSSLPETPVKAARWLGGAGRIIAAAVLLLAWASPCLAAGWLGEAWLYRRHVTLEKFTPAEQGSDIAVVTMPTGGLSKPDGSDICVATYDGKQVPCRVLMVGPGDQVRLAFGIQSGVNNYYVYWGNAKPVATKEPEIRRGVLLEMWNFPENTPIKNFEQVQKLFATVSASPKDLIGRDFRERIFQAHNPFGPQARIACIYTAYFHAPKTGEYEFSTSSQDASYLLIDDKLLIDNGGYHRPQSDISKLAKVNLDVGVHKMTFYHVSGGGGDPVAVVAWRSPGKDKVEPMPNFAFLPVVATTIGPMEEYAKELTIDFIPRQLGESFMADRYFQRFAFDALAAASKPGADTKWEWDFGDGQKSSAAKVEHVYLADGDYTVKLNAKTFVGTLTRTNKIRVARAWDRVTENKLDTLRQQADIVAKYDFAALSADANAQAVLLLHRAGEQAGEMKAGEALVARESAPAKLLAEAAQAYAETLIAAGQADKAVAALTKAAKIASEPNVSASLLVQAGRAALDEADQPKIALDIFEQILRKYPKASPVPAVRQARIGVGDSWAAQGDYDKAKETYTAAGVRADTSTNQPAVLKGDFARHVEDYIRQKNYDAAREWIDRWEDSFPLDKLEGYSTLLRCRLYQGAGEWKHLTLAAGTLVKVNPTSNYCPALLMLSAEAYTKLKQPDQAKAAWKQIVEKYPESPVAAEAAKKIKS